MIINVNYIEIFVHSFCLQCIIIGIEEHDIYLYLNKDRLNFIFLSSNRISCKYNL